MPTTAPLTPQADGTTAGSPEHPLLVTSRAGGYARVETVADIATLLTPKDVLVVNTATLGSISETKRPDPDAGEALREFVPARQIPVAGAFIDPVLLDTLHHHGVVLAPVTLHTAPKGDQSHLATEWFSVSQLAVDLITGAKETGRRVIALGTSALRAVEAAVGPDHHLREHDDGDWTNITINFECPPRIITGLLTGLHSPGSTHRDALAALTGWQLLFHAYNVAAAHGHYPGRSTLIHLALP